MLLLNFFFSKLSIYNENKIFQFGCEIGQIGFRVPVERRHVVDTLKGQNRKQIGENSRGASGL